MIKRLAARHPLLVGLASLTFAVATIYGCSNFLTDASAPEGTLDQSSLGNQAGVEGTLIATYRALDWTTGQSGPFPVGAANWVWGSVTSDDAYKGSEQTDSPDISDIEAYQWSTGNTMSDLNAKWVSLYEGVVRANSTLRLLKSVVASNPSAISTPAAASSIEGEAIFLRAHFHFEAYKLWGNIPYYREDDTDFRKANLDSAAVLTEIIKDLDAAAAKLPATPRDGQKGRVTSWTAKAYKGRVQLYAHQYAAALATLTDVKNNGPYGLETSFDKVYTGFAANANGPETIFAYQASSNDGEPNGNNADYGDRLTFPHSGSPFGCCGFHQPSQNLVNFYKVDAVTGLPTAMTPAPAAIDSTNWNADSTTLTASVSKTVFLDPRIDYTVGRDGVPYKDWGMHAHSWIRDPSNGGNYSNKKHVYEKASGAQSSVGWVNTQLGSVNVYLYRYGDLLLNLAEAEVEAGSLANATALVNQIRTRAGVTAQGCGLPADQAAAAAEVAAHPQCAGDARIAVPINDPSIDWAKYKIGLYPVFADKPTARLAVQNERRLELATESQRFFDLRRWGIAQHTLNCYIGNSDCPTGVGGGKENTRRLYLASAAVFSARHRWFPIPQVQIDASKVGDTSTLTQNTGW
jgi:hypothetical protein